MPLRSTNVVILLVLLNASAVFVGAMPVTDEVGYQPAIGGDDAIDEAQQTGDKIQSDRSSLDQFVGGIIAAASTIATILSVVVAGPQMLINLGAPTVLVTFIAAPLYILVALDLLQVLSGRDIV
jgi:hypothetical protein